MSKGRCLFLCLFYLCWAHASDAQVAPQITEAHRKALAEAAGVSPNDRFLDDFLRAALRPPDSLPVETPLKIIKHIRGKEGVALQPKNVTRKGGPLQVSIDESRLAAHNEKLVAHTFSKYNAPVQFRRCSGGKTSQYPLRDGATQNGGDALMFDHVFMTKESAPLDPDLIFGKTATIHLIDSSKRDPQGYSARGLGVKCLPTRLRATHEYFFVDEGENALRNYDGNFYGQGLLPQEVQRKVVEAKSQ